MRDDGRSDLRIGEWVPAQRTGPVPAAPAWAESEETVALPAFLRGQSAPVAAPPPAPEPPGGPADVADDGEKGLPASERNMLIFVSSLLAAGTLAIVAMGHGALDKHSSPPATITTQPAATGTPGNPAFVGSPDVHGYCDGLDGHLTSRPPGTGRAGWSCTGTGHATVTFTPTDVCRAQYGPASRAVYTTLSDTKTWRCLR